MHRVGIKVDKAFSLWPRPVHEKRPKRLGLFPISKTNLDDNPRIPFITLYLIISYSDNYQILI